MSKMKTIARSLAEWRATAGVKAHPVTNRATTHGGRRAAGYTVADLVRDPALALKVSALPVEDPRPMPRILPPKGMPKVRPAPPPPPPPTATGW